MEPLTISSVLLWVVLIFDLVLTLAVVRKVNSLTENGERPSLDTLNSGDPAPAFEAFTLGGEKVTLEKYFDKSVVFVFVSSKCGPCRERIPEIEKVTPIAREAGTDIVLVSNDDIETAREFFSGLNGYAELLVAPRSNNKFMDDYKVPATPYFCQVDSQGMIQTNGFFDHKWSSLVMQWVGNRPQGT